MDMVSYYEQEMRDIPINDGNEDPVIALIGKDAANWDAAVAAVKKTGGQIVFLEEGLPLHQYRLLLNEHRCDGLFYSRDYEELAYHVENNGTTMVHVCIPLDEEPEENR